MKKYILLLSVLLCGIIHPLTSQVDTTKIPVSYDTTITLPAESLFVIDTVVKIDTVITVDTTLKTILAKYIPPRDTIVRKCCKDSLVIVIKTKHAHEPSGFVRIAEHDFNTSIAKSWKGMAGQAGCWETNGGTAINNGKYTVTYPAGFADGKTPATLHAMSSCQSPKGYTQVYVHMSGFVPGDNGTSMWNNGEGNKLLFWHYGSGTGSPIFKCWDYQVGSVGGLRQDCTVNLYAQGAWLGSRTAKINAGVSNDIECILVLNTPGLANGTVTCWVNGVKVEWVNRTLRTSASSLVTELWLDWTYGGGGGGVAVGQRSIWTLDSFYASGK